MQKINKIFFSSVKFKMGLEHLLEEFYHAKDRLKELEDIINEYKDKIEDEMDRERLEYLETDNYYVERRKMSSETLKKSDCPKEVWNEYATRHSYTGLYIKKKGEKRRSRSPRRR
jgi:hypothetical protein